MPALVETMAYVAANGTPWHGLGNAVRPNMTPEEMLVAAGLDWQVERRLVRMRLERGNDEEMVIPNYMAIVRDTDNKVFQVASERYKPIQNAEVLQFFKEYTEAGGMNMETAGSLKQGAIIWSLAKIGKDFTLAGGDKVSGYLLLANSHDGSLSFSAQFTSVRVVCWNTLSAGLAEKKQGESFRMKHSKKFTVDVAKDAKVKLGLARKQMDAMQAAAQYLSESKVDFRGQEVREFIVRLTNPELLDNILKSTESKAVIERAKLHSEKYGVSDGASVLDAMLSDHDSYIRHVDQKISDEDLGRVGRAILDDIITSPGANLPSAKNTWWGVLNGVTRWADHDSGRDRDTALQSSWFGVKNTLKNDALTMAVQYAKAS